MEGPLRGCRTDDRRRTPLVIATLGAIFGPGDKDYEGTPRTGFTDYLDGDLPLIPSDFVLPWDYVEDTAEHLKRAMDRGDPGEEYIIANEPQSMSKVFDLAEDLTGVSPPSAVPGTVFRLLGAGVAFVENFRRPPEGFESELLQFFASGAVLVDNEKTHSELDIEHRSLVESLQLYLDWELRQQGMETDVDRSV